MSISAANNPLKLRKRLLSAAFAVRSGCRAADVGCDHGKLSAWLILSGKCTFVSAIDVSEPSLKKAADLFSSLGIGDRTKTVLSDGLSSVCPSDADDVIIAGLGADVTSDIISRAPWLKDGEKRLILVPSSHHAKLRTFLYAEGYEILSERAVLEAGQVYAVMTAKFRGHSRQLTPVFAEIGKILDSDGDKSSYLGVVRRRHKMRLDEIRNARTGDIRKTRESREILAFLDSIGE